MDYYYYIILCFLKKNSSFFTHLSKIALFLLHN